MNDTTKEKLAEQLHLWYLEACQKPESGFEFNPKAQEPYEALPEGSKFLDRYLAEKILGLFSSQKQAVVEMIESKRRVMEEHQCGEALCPHYPRTDTNNRLIDDILNELKSI